MSFIDKCFQVTMNGRTCRYLCVLFLSTVGLYMYFTTNILSLDMKFVGNYIAEPPMPGQYTFRNVGQQNAGIGLNDKNVSVIRSTILFSDTRPKDSFQEAVQPLPSLADLRERIAEEYRSLYQTNSKSEVLSTAKIILIIAYMRTGSTLTGSLFQEYPGTFYVFEPIRGVHERFKKANNNSVTLKYMDGQRNFNTSEEPSVFNREIKDWLTCNLKQLSLPTLTDPFHQQYTKYMRTFRACLQRYTSVKGLSHQAQRYMKALSTPTSVNTCLDKVIQVCKASPAIVLKFIRLQMKQVFQILPHFPNLKIVHLVRDPRGIFNSRIRIGRGVKGSVNKADVDKFHRTLTGDLSYSKFLLEKDPSRLKILQYEDLAEFPMETAKEILSFAGLSFETRVENFLKHMTASSRDSCAFCTLRKNSTATASKWRSKLKLQDSIYLYHTCREIMDVLGYLPFSSNMEMKNLELPSRLQHNVTSALLNDEHF